MAQKKRIKPKEWPQPLPGASSVPTGKAPEKSPENTTSEKSRVMQMLKEAGFENVTESGKGFAIIGAGPPPND